MKRTDRCVCGHERIQHIYEEGACRPGFVCEKKCEQFIDIRKRSKKMSKLKTLETQLSIAVSALKSTVGYEPFDGGTLEPYRCSEALRKIEYLRNKK